MKFKENHGEVDVDADDDNDETCIKEPPKATLNLHPTKLFLQT